MREFQDQSHYEAPDAGRCLIAEGRTLAAVVPNWAASGLAACTAVFALTAPGDAWAQTASVVAPYPNLGNVVAAASGVTTFRFTPGGVVTKLSGNGVRLSTGSAEFNVSIACTTCDKSNTTVTIAATSGATGRAGTLSNFNVTLGTGATLATGTSLPAAGSPYTFTLGPIAKKPGTALLTIGADFPINGDAPLPAGATGTANSPISITIAGKPAVPASATATVFRSLSISGTNMEFGRIVRPASGSSSIAIPATTGTRFVGGSAIGLPTPAPTRALFTVLGEPSQSLTLTIPTSIMLKDANSDSLTITTSSTAAGSPSLDANGTLTFYMGGAFSITSTTPTGAYTGTFTVTAVYN